MTKYVVLPVEPTYKMITGGHRGFDLCSCSLRRKIIEDAIANAPQPDVVVVERGELESIYTDLVQDNDEKTLSKVTKLMEGAG